MTEKATFGAGCFWGVEDVFSRINGVISTAVGYSGGNHKNPNYKDVCTGTTGHAEVVHLEYDPSTVSYETLLQTFWDNHDPTTLHRQGPDVGTQYRSVVFFHTPELSRCLQSSARKNKPVQAAHRHRDHKVRNVLPRGGLPSEVPGETWPQSLLDLVLLKNLYRQYIP